jgi:hypothetical protein
MLTAMGQLSPRQEKKRQLVRYGYTGVGVGAVLVLIAVLAASLFLGIVGAVVLALALWAIRLVRGA